MSENNGKSQGGGGWIPLWPAEVTWESHKNTRAAAIKRWREDSDYRASLLEIGITLEAMLVYMKGNFVDGGRVFQNDTYQVVLKEVIFGDQPGWHLSIKRLDREPITDWRHKQLIKNQLLGPEVEAVEIYPAESRLVDTANQYHLWAYQEPGYRFPLGFSVRLALSGELGNSKQRDFSEV